MQGFSKPTEGFFFMDVVKYLEFYYFEKSKSGIFFVTFIFSNSAAPETLARE